MRLPAHIYIRSLFGRGEIRTVVIVLTTIGFIAILGSAYERYATHVLSDALYNAVVRENVSIGGTDYRVESGNVYKNGKLTQGTRAFAALRLAYAKALARRSPLIALAGTDPDALLAAVTGLKTTSDELANIQEKKADADLVRSSLYPIAFLSAAAKLEQARIAFLSSGSDLDEKAYAAAQYDAVSTFDRDLARYRRAFEQSVPADAREYLQVASIINRAGVLKVMQALAEGMGGTKRQMQMRTLCTAGLVATCRQTDIEIPPLPQKKYSEVPSDSLRLAMEVRSIFAEAGNNRETNSQPLILLSDSACATRIPSAPLFISDRNSVPDRPGKVAIVKFVGDIRFLESETLRAVPFFKFLADNDVRYVSSSPLTHYMCSSSGRDIGTVLAVRAVGAFAQRAILHEYAEGVDAKRLSELEEALSAGSPVIKESDALAYLAAAEDLAMAGALPREEAYAVDELSLAIRNATAGYDVAVDMLSGIEDTNMRIFARDVPVDISLPYLFFFRSALELLFMGGNPSATDLSGNLFETYVGEQPYVYYSQMPTTVTRARIIHDLRAYLRLHILPLDVPITDVINGS